MKIHPLFASGIVTALFAVQGWTLLEVVNMKVEIARLTVKLESMSEGKKHNEQNQMAVAR